MFSFTLMVVVFILGYTAIALEHSIKIDKAASALMLGVLVWAVYLVDVSNILSLGFSDAWKNFSDGSLIAAFMKTHPDATLLEQMRYFVIDKQVVDIRLHPQTIENAKKVGGGYDIYMLEHDWKRMLKERQSMPNKPQGSFVAFVKWYVKKHGRA